MIYANIKRAERRCPYTATVVVDILVVPAWWLVLLSSSFFFFEEDVSIHIWKSDSVGVL
jgi:hypothetical protein